MSEKSKGDTSSRVVVKNPLLSASVTGLTYDDFPNKPHLLPAAPPAPAVVPIINRDPNPLVTVGATDIDTESLDEISLNTTSEDLQIPAPDANANQLYANTPDTDSLLSQAASSFSALPSVASSVFSTFSKRIYSGSTSRELTPTTTDTRTTPDPNANLIQPYDSTPGVYPGQSQIQQHYQQQLIEPSPVLGGPPPAQIFGAPPPGGTYYGGPPETSVASQQPPPEPPKFYTPTEVPSLPSVATLPSSGQNTYRLTARKKVYAPIPGLSDQFQQQVPTINTSAVNAPLNASQYEQPQQQSKQEERKKGGLFSLTNLVPTGVLQNISGFVQSAAGGAPQTGDTNYFGVTPAPELIAVPQPNLLPSATAPQQSNFFAPPPAVSDFQAPPPPQSYAAVGVEQQLTPAPPYPGALPTNFSTSPTSVGTENKTAQVDSSYLAPQVEFQTSSAGASIKATEFTSQVGPNSAGPTAQPPQASVSIFNPAIQQHHEVTSAGKEISQTSTPDTLTAPPSIISGSTPPKSAPTSFRLQKGTRLYKNPLTAAETAPVQIAEPLGQRPAQISQVLFNPFATPVAPPGQSAVSGFPPPNFETKPSVTQWQTQPPVESIVAPPVERPHQLLDSGLRPHFETKPAVTQWQPQTLQANLFAPPLSSNVETKTSTGANQWQPQPPQKFYNPFAPPVGTASDYSAAPIIEPIISEAPKDLSGSSDKKYTSEENAYKSELINAQVEPPKQPAGSVETNPNLSFFEEQIIELPESGVEKNPITAEADESDKTLDALEETLKNLSHGPPAKSSESKVLAPPPPLQVTGSQNQTNPYRRESISHGSGTASTKQLNLANFFTPVSNDLLAGGDFNFFNFPQQETVKAPPLFAHGEKLADNHSTAPGPITTTEAANFFSPSTQALRPSEDKQSTVGGLPPPPPLASQTKGSELQPSFPPAVLATAAFGTPPPPLAGETKASEPPPLFPPAVPATAAFGIPPPPLTGQTKASESQPSPLPLLATAALGPPPTPLAGQTKASEPPPSFPPTILATAAFGPPPPPLAGQTKASEPQPSPLPAVLATAAFGPPPLAGQTKASEPQPSPLPLIPTAAFGPPPPPLADQTKASEPPPSFPPSVLATAASVDLLGTLNIPITNQLEPSTTSALSVDLLLPTVTPREVKQPTTETATPTIPFAPPKASLHFTALEDDPPNIPTAPIQEALSTIPLLPTQSNLLEPQEAPTPTNFFSNLQPSAKGTAEVKPPSAFQSIEAKLPPTPALHPATTNFFTNPLSTGKVTETALPLNPSIAPPISSAHFFDNQQKLAVSSGGPPAPILFPSATAVFPPLPVFSNTTPTPTADSPLPGSIPPPLGFEQLLTDASRDASDKESNVTLKTDSSKIENPNQSTHSGHIFSNFFQETKLSPKPQIQPQFQQISVPPPTAGFFDTFTAQISQVPPIPVGQNASEEREDQRIQNFFNNPPPQDNSTGIGELTYDFIHSGLGVKNLEERSTTPFSNLVEPPLSSCSEWSELNISSSEQKLASEGASKLNSPQHSLADGVTLSEPADDDVSTPTHTPALLKHYEELPDEILKELRMANMLTDEVVAVPSSADVQGYSPAIKHWFYKRVVGTKDIWTPFSHYDSALLETSLTADHEVPNVVAVEGGRYDVHIRERTKVPVYWEGEPIDVRRCSWFYKATDSRYVPYDEEIADLLEAEYKSAAESGVWHQKIIISMGEQVVFHGPTVIVHFQRQLNDDAWGGSTQTSTRPRVVKRDLNDFIIEPGESQHVDHLLFMVHGIGAACDLKMRSVEEVVDEFRSIAQQLVQSHYKNSTETGLVGRVEVLPISWHSHLHSDEMGIDDQLKSITLESIPKLRNFTNDTLLDILFYTSPLYCQKIMNTVATSLNTVYLKYRERHPDFHGGVSLAGHSLGSLILFDLLCHQHPVKECEEENMENPDQQFGTLDAASSSNEVVAKHISYTMGAAGTGQPFIHYAQLIFQPKKFFALGSPIGMFVTIRGIDKLGLDFRLPTCAGFYNIFHPFDPVAYRIEALVNPDMCGVRPVLIPHHKGRKRMHLELRDTMTRVGADLKQRFFDKFKNTLDSVNFLSTRSKKEAEEALEKEVDSVLEMQIQLERQQQNTLSPDQPQSGSSHSQNRSRADSTSTTHSDADIAEVDVPLGKLNDSKRIDYVLQEAPLEFFNEYVFALSSHVCYWSSEDTILFVMKEIYSGLGISPDSQVPQQSMTIERPSSRNSVAMSLLS